MHLLVALVCASVRESIPVTKVCFNLDSGRMASITPSVLLDNWGYILGWEEFVPSHTLSEFEDIVLHDGFLQLHWFVKLAGLAARTESATGPGAANPSSQSQQHCTAPGTTANSTCREGIQYIYILIYIFF